MVDLSISCLNTVVSRIEGEHVTDSLVLDARFSEFEAQLFSSFNQTLKISFLQCIIGTLGHLFKLRHFPLKNVIVRGVGGVPDFFGYLES